MTGSPLHIEPFDPDRHMDAVLDIEVASFAADAYSRRFFHELHRKGKQTFLVALRDNRVVGYISGYITAASIGYIASLAVMPDHRRTGAGESLITDIVARMAAVHRAREIWLHVRRSNIAAIALYKKCGFQITGFLRDYYPDGEPATLMKLKIPQANPVTHVQQVD